jgi:hypothetical protein
MDVCELTILFLSLFFILQYQSVMKVVQDVETVKYTGGIVLGIDCHPFHRPRQVEVRQILLATEWQWQGEDEEGVDEVGMAIAWVPALPFRLRLLVR